LRVSMSGLAADQHTDHTFESGFLIYHRYGCWLRIGAGIFVRTRMRDQRRRRYRRGGPSSLLAFEAELESRSTLLLRARQPAYHRLGFRFTTSAGFTWVPKHSNLRLGFRI
jgi:hypothetical protein